MSQISSAPAPAAGSARVLVVPSDYPGVSAQDAAQFLGEGIRSVIRDAEVTLAPLPNGGAGTSELFVGQRVSLPTTDAAGQLTEASYTFDRATATAYVDAASVVGAPAGVGDKGDTYGVGVLVADAATRGARRVVLSLGDVVTVDGGTGILVALAVNPLNAAGFTLGKGAAALAGLEDFDTAKLNVAASALEWVLLADDMGGVDVSHPGLARLCEVTGVDPETPGYGAGGAIPVALHWLSALLHGNADKVRVVPGAEVVAQALDLPAQVAEHDFVVTGGQAGSAVAGQILTAAGETVVGLAGVDKPEASGSRAVVAELADLAELTAGRREEALRAAGAQLAADYLRISTVQG